MLKKINTYLFNKRARNYLSSTPREHRFVNYEKAKTVLLLFESDASEQNPKVRSIINQLQQDGKKVTAWGFVDKKEIETAIYPDFRILHHKQTDFFHRPLESYKTELQYAAFDLLIDLTVKPVVPLLYLAMYAVASFKTGLRKTEIPLYDFVLDMESKPVQPDSSDPLENPVDETYLYNQIIFYLKNIQTTD
ncbi:MAG: hypothetical protein Q8904_10385 [Bacteroidota bacterium]|nr:hypothetical protein [Bacteroidota bacterium]